MKKWVVTIPTRGYVVYEVTAACKEEALGKLRNLGGKLVEENQGDWDDSDEWEVEGFDIIGV